MDNFSFLMRTNMKFGAGEMENLPKYVLDLSLDRAVVIVDPAVI